ncbi:hypothetical protein CRUP_006182 [Coryphaenoides rupestris]|nr:hypothetical protein CRUP_006182 [Coryphaenoides rupestris]
MANTMKTSFPDDWEDDQRMNFLFSDFKENRDVNPSDWDSKMDFWSSLVVRTWRARGAVSCSLEQLNAPLKWTFSALLGSSRFPQEESFVVIDLVKEKAAELLEAYRASAFSSRSLLSFQELCELSSDVCPEESTLCMALLQLQREKMCTVSLHEGEKIVKFSQPGQNRVSPASDVDVGIYQLQRSEKLLDERINALRCLRGRKRVEKRTDNLFAQLETIRGILDRIAQSQTDKLVMQAYQTGVAALRLSLSDVTVEGAESLVDQIQELCDVQDEVNQTIAGVASSDENVDELEEELKALMEDAKTEGISGTLPAVPSTPLVPAREPGQGAGTLLSSLPSVPTHTFDVTSEQLEEELNRLTLKDLKYGQNKTTSPRKTLKPAQ